MDTLIDKLSEIEESASGILEGAKNQKAELDREQQERMDAYDKQAEENVQRELDNLQKELAASKETQLASLRSQADEHMKEVSAYYEKNHDALTDEIFNRIVRK